MKQSELAIIADYVEGAVASAVERLEERLDALARETGRGVTGAEGLEAADVENMDRDAARAALGAVNWTRLVARAMGDPNGKAGATLNELLRQTDGAVFTLTDRIEELEQRIAAQRWRGVWSATTDDYVRGQTCTDRGALWHCTRDGTTDRPGESSDWVLMTKTR
jgi:hypothetical protein